MLAMTTPVSESRLKLVVDAKNLGMMMQRSYILTIGSNATINYADGVTAINTVNAAPAAPVASAPAASSSAPVASSESSVAPAAQAPATTNDPTVYVTGGGSSAV